MKYVWTFTYAISLLAAVCLICYLLGATGHPILAGACYILGMLAYAFLIQRRCARAHPTDPPPAPDRRAVDSLIAAAEPRHAVCADCQATNDRPTTPVRQVTGAPPRGLLGLDSVGAPAPAAGPDPTYRIDVITPGEEAQKSTWWVNEAMMLRMLEQLTQRYFKPALAPHVRPRIKIEPTFDLRVANHRARQLRDLRNPPFELPQGLRPHFVGLLG